MCISSFWELLKLCLVRISVSCTDFALMCPKECVTTCNHMVTYQIIASRRISLPPKISTNLSKYKLYFTLLCLRYNIRREPRTRLRCFQVCTEFDRRDCVPVLRTPPTALSVRNLSSDLFGGLCVFHHTGEISHSNTGRYW